jgi:hypothetical protein
VRPVGGSAIFHGVVQDDAVVIVGDLGLVAELDGPVDAAFADRPRVGVVQADQPGRAVRHLPSQPGPGLRHDRGGALDGDRQIVQRPPQSAVRPAGQCPGKCPRAVAQHRGGLRRGLLRQARQLCGDPADRLLLSSRDSFSRLRSLSAISRTRRAAARRRPVITVRGASPAAWTRRAARTSLTTALASSPESAG